STWEGGMREPTIAWWPGHIPAGTSSDAVTGNLDILPTFAKLAGGEIPAAKKIDGVDIWPVLSGDAQQSSREAQYYFNGNRLEAVRSGPWKLAIVHQPEHNGQPGDTAVPQGTFAPKLFNLDEDIGESKDVAAQRPEIVQRLQSLVERMDADLGRTRLGP